MHLQVLFVVFAQCLTLSCLINGAPAGGSDQGEPSASRGKRGYPYTEEENAFIKDQVLAQQKIRDVVSWKKIAVAHERKLQNKEFGFNTKRTADGLRKHFEMIKAGVSAWKQRNTVHAQKYTKQEEDLINKELSNSNHFAHLYSDPIWENILAAHNFKREQNIEGFSIERSITGLRSHFQLSMKPGQRVSEEVKARFPKNFKTSTEGSSTSSSSNKRLRIDLNSMPSEEDVDEDY